eukprot:CAMPEP_0115036424 /NCGR_PEP_ID=MMETSP0216-20121206/42123_1 /TAXON_ID=223996 /ORGANISM="Protocruzia adherens, Strain Boccale" /LENGTH=689 /DNA_ID=CAMNT_0002416267 /DNA_START=487 /DNA_END=2552 /DNA_ORIENTATION=-
MISLPGDEENLPIIKQSAKKQPSTRTKVPNPTTFSNKRSQRYLMPETFRPSAIETDFSLHLDGFDYNYERPQTTRACATGGDDDSAFKFDFQRPLTSRKKELKSILNYHFEHEGTSKRTLARGPSATSTTTVSKDKKSANKTRLDKSDTTTSSKNQKQMTNSLSYSNLKPTTTTTLLSATRRKLLYNRSQETLNTTDKTANKENSAPKKLSTTTTTRSETPKARISAIKPSITSLLNNKKKGSLTPKVNKSGSKGDGSAAATAASSPGGRQMVNLEEVIYQEGKFWNILEGLRSGQDIGGHCSDWIQLTAETTLVDVDKLFRDEKTRRAIRQFLILETMAVVVTDYMLVESKDAQQVLLSHLKNLFYYIHQSFLIFCSFILTRLPSESNHNIWAYTIKSLINTRQGPRKASSLTLKQNNEIIQSILKTLSHSAERRDKQTIKPCDSTKKPIFVALSSILKHIDRMSLDKCRNIIKKARDASVSVKPDRASIHRYIDEEEEESQVLNLNTDEPYLPPHANPNGYTLVLDLDETLIHYFDEEEDDVGGHFLIRPGTEDFLEEMSQHYELVVFTAGMQDYADWVLDQLDPHGFIKYRLYRQHTEYDGNVYIKDLSRLGRDLDKTLIIDNVPENFQRQPDNGIYIKTWIDDMTDTAFEQLTPLLLGIVDHQIPDVSAALKQFRQELLDQMDET